MTPKQYIDINRERIIEDIKYLVNIKSVKDEPGAKAPYGEGIRKAQLAAMDLCKKYGFDVYDANGHIAWAHFGPEDKFICIMAHLDVVPEGDGWDSNPYECIEKEGYLVGRGTGDDKGPFVMGLWAARYLIENVKPLKYGIRLLLGLDEESGMEDIEYYIKNFTKPVFSFTPDANFPVCNGEKGICHVKMTSPDLGVSTLLEFSGGLAPNVVPDEAYVSVSSDLFGDLSELAESNEDIVVLKDKVTKIKAKGISAHAGSPYDGKSAIHSLSSFLLSGDAINKVEREALLLIEKLSGDFSGKSVGIDRDCEIFTPLTVNLGLISMKENKFEVVLDIRYPISVAPEEIEKMLSELAREYGYEIIDISNKPPFYINPESPVIETLTRTFEEAYGEKHEPYVMSGGTYARKMDNAVAFGPGFPNRKKPDWAGDAHMKNEALSIEDTFKATEIYCESLIALQELDF
ncbi:MAG: M20 family metallopeptidase [Ruminococcaceae bacterium]|nr:M20 family metallopeptidase [Oscillospiraceae bacterium]